MNLKAWCLKNAKEKYLKQWDEELNLAISPDEISYGSTKKVHWICEKRHRWVSSVNARTSKGESNCPYCSGKRVWRGFNDLETLHPKIALEWDYDKNNAKPSDFLSGSNKKVGWICLKGHHYEAKINDRTKAKGTGCPYCSGNKPIEGENDFATVCVDLMKEWDYEKNVIQPSDISAVSGRKFGGNAKKVTNGRRACQIGEEEMDVPTVQGKSLLLGKLI